jgi:hypothetical protein
MEVVSVTPAERRLRAKIAVNVRLAKYDPHELTRGARERRERQDRLRAPYERQIDPYNTLPPMERRRRAGHLMQADLYREELRALREGRQAEAAS